jgi:hypothetical protein
MSQVKRYITPLEVRLLDGRHVFCDLTLEIPTGSYDTSQDSFWMLLLGSLARRKSITAWEEDQDSLRGGRQSVLPLS